MGKRRPAPGWITLRIVLALSILLLSSSLPAAPDDSSVKGSFQKMGRAAESAGKEVGKSAADAGKAVGRESRKIWYRGVQVSKPALEQARRETRAALRKTLAAMDRSIESLKKELQRLEAEEARRGPPVSPR